MHLAYTFVYKPSPDRRSTLETTDLDGNRIQLIEGKWINRSPAEMSRVCWLPDGRLVYCKDTSEVDSDFLTVEVDVGSGYLRSGPRRLFGMDRARLFHWR